LGIHDVLSFDFLDPPSEYQIFEDTYVMPPKEVQTNNQESAEDLPF
jgi:hypothetical protein